MKLKKLVALAAVAAMSLSAVAANAASISYDEDNWVLVDASATKAEISARQPSIDPSVEKINLAAAMEYGITKGKGGSEKTDDNTDFYKLTIKVSNLGDLYEAYLDDDEYLTRYSVKLQNIAITVPGISANKQAITSSSFEGNPWAVGGNGIQLTMGTSANDAYPKAGEEGIYVNDTVIEAVVVYAVEKGATLDVEPTAVVTYSVNKGEFNADANGVATKNVVFAEPVVEEPKIVSGVVDGMNVAINNKVNTLPTGDALKGVRVKVTYDNDTENAKTFGASLYDTLKDVEGGNVAVIFGVAYEGDLTASLFSFEVIQ